MLVLPFPILSIFIIVNNRAVVCRMTDNVCRYVALDGFFILI